MPKSSLHEQIEVILRTNFQPTQLEIEDDSAAHAGHAGNRGGGHFSVLLVSAQFKGKSLLDRHREVNEALKDQLRLDIHALSLKTLTPEEWDVVRSPLIGQ